MQTLDAASFEADGNDILYMLCFADDGDIRWSTGLGKISTGFEQRIVHVFRASCSISQAFAKGFGENHVNNNSSGQKQKREEAEEDSILVKCEKDMVILAKRVYGDSSLWFALVGKPFTLDYGWYCLVMLQTLEQLASVLFPGTKDDSYNSLYELCDSTCQLLKSTSFWLGNDKGRVTHFMNSLFAFCNTQNATDMETSCSEEQDHQSSTTTAQQALSISLESLQLDISHHFGSSRSRLLVFSVDLKPLFAQSISHTEKRMLMWYYSTCLASRLRGFNSYFSEQNDRGILRIWYRRRGLIMFTNFIAEKTPTGKSMPQVRRSADALIDAVLVANK